MVILTRCIVISGHNLYTVVGTDVLILLARQYRVYIEFQDTVPI